MPIARRWASRAQSFDKFVYWAQLIISDFNDIDRSMADAGEIYRNLDSLNSLGSNYLTPEVQEAVERVSRTEPVHRIL